MLVLVNAILQTLDQNEILPGEGGKKSHWDWTPASSGIHTILPQAIVDCGVTREESFDFPGKGNSSDYCSAESREMQASQRLSKNTNF